MLSHHASQVRLAVALLVALFLSACGTPSGGSRSEAPRKRAPAAGVPAQETPAQEAARIRAQRDNAATNGVVVYSAGSLGRVGWFKMLVEPTVQNARASWLQVSTNCAAECLRRKLRVKQSKVVIHNTLSVSNLAPGRWRVTKVRFGRREKKLTTPIIFEVKKGYATYLGGFAIQVNPTLNVYRYSAIQSDMSRALSQYPQTRGRRMINTARKLRKPTLMR